MVNKRIVIVRDKEEMRANAIKGGIARWEKVKDSKKRSDIMKKVSAARFNKKVPNENHPAKT